MKEQMHDSDVLSDTSMPVLPAREYARLLLAFLVAAALLTAACLGQDAPPAVTAGDAQTIVRNASYNELHASNGHHPFRYRVASTDDGKSTVKEVVETKDGDMRRLLEQGGQPLTPDAEQAEITRLKKLRGNPAEQQRRHQKAKAEGEREDEMVKLLPDAFVYVDAGEVPGPNGPCHRLLFKPNPAFHPPDRQAEVYHGMEGELWIDDAQQRMVRLDAHLVSDVGFGWGIVGQLFKGGTILVDQKDVGDHHWETTREELHLNGKILLVKSLEINTTDLSSDFAPVPDDGYQAAIDSLLAMPAH